MPKSEAAGEDIRALKVRVDDLLASVNLANDIDADMASTIAVTEMGDVTMCDESKKYVVLMHRKKITTDEHRRLVERFVDEHHAKTQN